MPQRVLERCRSWGKEDNLLSQPPQGYKRQQEATSCLEHLGEIAGAMNDDQRLRICENVRIQNLGHHVSHIASLLGPDKCLRRLQDEVLIPFRNFLKRASSAQATVSAGLCEKRALLCRLEEWVPPSACTQ